MSWKPRLIADAGHCPRARVAPGRRWVPARYLIMGLKESPQFAATFKEFPPRQKAASFTIDDALAKMGCREWRRALSGGAYRV
jgi:hypothetical protein